MDSEDDMILLSCLPRAPAAGADTSVICSALQRVLLRTPRSLIPVGDGVGRSATGRPHLNPVCPSAHTKVVDTRLLRAVPLGRARAILGRIAPPRQGLAELPTIMVAVHSKRSGPCYLGQRITSSGYSTFTVHPALGKGPEDIGTGGGGRKPMIDDLVRNYAEEFGNGRETQATARCLYDLWGSSGRDVVGGSLPDLEGLEGDENAPFARLAVEWDCLSCGTRTLGSPPPPTCSSLLLVGGPCPLSSTGIQLREDLKRLSSMADAATAETTPSSAKSEPYAQSSSELISAEVRETDDCHKHENPNQQKLSQARWEADLALLLSGSEGLADMAAKTASTGSAIAASGPSSVTGEDVTTDVDSRVEATETSMVTEKDVGGTRTGQGQGHRCRDLDFSERLWELVSIAPGLPRGGDDARYALRATFDAVREGRIFPLIRRDNETAVGRHIRKGVDIAQQFRYAAMMRPRTPGGGPGGGGNDVETRTRAWKEWNDQGKVMLQSIQSAALVCLELGVCKLRRDFSHWLEQEAGVSVAEIEHALPPVSRLPGAQGDPGGGTGALGPEAAAVAAEADRLYVLADTLDLVALGQFCDLPWRQGKALAQAGLERYGRLWAEGRETLATAGRGIELSRPRPPPPVFGLGLRDVPSRTRSKLATPLLWELYIKAPAAQGPAAWEGGDGGTRDSRGWKRGQVQGKPAGLVEG
ncbi:unnamed protein product, partial [Discosporangium mesarthrocarpum]